MSISGMQRPRVGKDLKDVQRRSDGVKRGLEPLMDHERIIFGEKPGVNPRGTIKGVIFLRERGREREFLLQSLCIRSE